MAFLNINELIEQHPSSTRFFWLLQTYVPWHAVAVILAEICSEPEGLLAYRAWDIIQNRFKDWRGRIADINEAMIGNVVRNLFKRARAAQKTGFRVI